MPITFKAKTNREKLVETVKTLTQPAVKYVSGAWTLLRTHPFFRTLFTSKWSFIGILVLTPILIGFCLMLPVTHEAMGYQMESPFWAMILKSLLGMAISALGYLAIFGFLSALYLTFSDNWHLFFRWWSVGLARRKDRMASVTSSPLIVRERLSQFDAEDGIFLTCPDMKPMRIERAPYYLWKYAQACYKTRIWATFTVSQKHRGSND